ncbi:MAG: TlpA family protein disulfide reductase [Rubrivivax sp.]|nr:TlpA family protein disulfide reductase [Rubrivivax sp.]
MGGAPLWHHDRMQETCDLAWSRRAWLARAAAAAGTLTALAASAQQPPAGEAKAGPPPPLGTRIVLPAVPMLDGSVFDPSSAEGRVLVIYWWASWCPFCALQSPLMDQLWREQRARGLQMLGLSIDKKVENAQGYMAKRGYTFPSGLVTPEVERTLPKPKGLPVTFVRGRDGRLLMAEAGQLFPEDVAQIAGFL